MNLKAYNVNSRHWLERFCALVVFSSILIAMLSCAVEPPEPWELSCGAGTNPNSPYLEVFGELYAENITASVDGKNNSSAFFEASLVEGRRVSHEARIYFPHRVTENNQDFFQPGSHYEQQSSTRQNEIDGLYAEFQKNFASPQCRNPHYVSFYHEMLNVITENKIIDQDILYSSSASEETIGTSNVEIYYECANYPPYQVKRGKRLRYFSHTASPEKVVGHFRRNVENQAGTFEAVVTMPNTQTMAIHMHWDKNSLKYHPYACF